MRISTKGRYGLAAIISMAQNYESGQCITVISLSEKLGISKIYLEQVFSLLKRADLVWAIKGAQGGYRLSRAPQEMSALEVLQALEQSLFEKTEESVFQSAPDIEKSMQALVFSALDESVEETLREITVYDLVQETERQKSSEGLMFYI